MGGVDKIKNLIVEKNEEISTVLVKMAMEIKVLYGLSLGMKWELLMKTNEIYQWQNPNGQLVQVDDITSDTLVMKKGQLLEESVCKVMESQIEINTCSTKQ